MNLSNLSLSERKAWMLKHLDKGSFMSVTWNTAKSGLTTRNVKKWVESAFVSGDRSIVQHNPVSHKPEYITVTDMAKLAKGEQYCWSNINLLTLKQVKVGGISYEF